MAIAFDVASFVGNVASPTALSHTCAVGATLLVAHVRPGGGGTLTGVTYNGVAMTLINSGVAIDTYSLWYLFNPASGAHNIVATMTGGSVLFVEAASYTGTTVTGVDASATSAAAATSVTTIADNCWCVYGSADRTGADPTAVSGCVRRAAAGSGGSMGLFDSNGPKTPAGSTTLTTSASGSIVGLLASFGPALATNTGQMFAMF
jgi:hypothetical protein